MARPRSGSASCPAASRASSRAGRRSGWRSRGRWPPSRSCCCSTSRWPRWTSPSPRRCGRRCAGCSPTAPWSLVTHDPLDALLLADRVVVLDAGRVVEDGPSGGGAVPAAERVRGAAGRAQPGRGRLGGRTRWSPTTGLAVQGLRRRSRRPLTGDAVVATFRPAAVAVYRERAAGQPAQRLRGHDHRARAARRPGAGRAAATADLSADVTVQAAAELELAGRPAGHVHGQGDRGRRLPALTRRSLGSGRGDVPAHRRGRPGRRRQRRHAAALGDRGQGHLRAPRQPARARGRGPRSAAGLARGLVEHVQRAQPDARASWSRSSGTR